MYNPYKLCVQCQESFQESRLNTQGVCALCAIINDLTALVTPSYEHKKKRLQENLRCVK